MNNLTCVIAFINEGAELYATLSSIRQTAGSRVDILLVDDGSDDGVDYEVMAEMFGADISDTPCVRALHPPNMRVSAWSKRPASCFSTGICVFTAKTGRSASSPTSRRHPRLYIAGRCRGLEPGDTAHTFGAFVNFDKTEIFAAKWLTGMPDDGDESMKIPCIIGASYAGSVDTFNRLRGFEGLTGYGAEEEYLSIKAWMSGGGVRQIRDVVVGHRFNVSRIVGGRPKFVTSGYEVLHNRMVIASTLLPERTAAECMRYWSKRQTRYAEARAQIEREAEHIAELREYYMSRFRTGSTILKNQQQSTTS